MFIINKPKFLASMVWLTYVTYYSMSSVPFNILTVHQTLMWLKHQKQVHFAINILKQEYLIYTSWDLICKHNQKCLDEGGLFIFQ